VWRVTFDGPKGNVLDASVMTALTEVFRDAAQTPTLRAICLEGQGADFSYGASVQEHLPEQVEGMLRRFDELIAALLECEIVVVAAVRGRCLGGGLELASLCHRVIASRDATFGQPEIRIGVFAPVASVVLADRVGRGHAEDLCLTGRTIGAAEALAMHLIDQIADTDPMDSAIAYAREHLVPHSASSLRLAVRACRMSLEARLAVLPAVERLYLDRLMRTDDAREGITAFLEKRSPVWKNR
jgi:cyclohexa-1,5-dienecarbonyl-CoA hydratase